MEVIYGKHRVLTDQSIQGGGGDEAMAPFYLFMALIISCSSIFALSFLQQRDLNTEGLNIKMYPNWNNEDHRINNIRIEIDTPKDFPEKYKGTLEKVVDACTVKRHLYAPPSFDILVK